MSQKLKFKLSEKGVIHVKLRDLLKLDRVQKQLAAFKQIRKPKV